MNITVTPEENSGMKRHFETFEERKAFIGMMTLFDDLFFSVIMRNMKAAEYVLRILMNKPDLKIIRAEP